MDRRWLLALIGLAVGVRLAYLAWAPGIPTGDDFFYWFYGLRLFGGYGYTEMDGSPGVFWMPGWPVILAGLAACFGTDPVVGMVVNALFGAASTGLVAVVGARIAGARAGAFAGGVYALWPGLVYFTATLMVEPAFNFFLCLALAAWSRLSCDLPSRRPAWSFAGGLALAACAWLKAEPLVLTPFAVLFLWVGRTSRRDFWRCVAAFLAALVLGLGPWAVRNLHAVDRLLVTSASGGTNFWIGNHEGSTGANDLKAERAFRQRHRRDTLADANLAQNDAGWREGWAAVRRDPGAALARVPRKLALTYGSDGAGARNLAGAAALDYLGIAVDPEQARRARGLAPIRHRLVRLADTYWWLVLALAAVGLVASRRWTTSDRVLVLATPAAWLLTHAVFLGGPRFHVPEAPALALLAGAGLEALIRLRFGTAHPPAWS